MNNKISQNTKKELCKTLGDRAGNEIYCVLNGLLSECESLRKSKVSVSKLFSHNTSLMDYKYNQKREPHTKTDID